MSLLDETTDLHNLANQVLTLLDAQAEAVFDMETALKASTLNTEYKISNLDMASELLNRLRAAHRYSKTVIRQTLRRLEDLGSVESVPPTAVSLTPYGIIERITGYSSYISSTIQNILSDVATPVDNNRATALETQTPPDIVTFYDGNRFRGPFGDAVLYRITMSAKPTDIGNVASQLSIWIDYGAPGVQLFKQTKPLVLGYGIEEPINYVVPVYIGTTFAAQGGRLMVEADGAVELSKVSYLISRLHKKV